MPTHKWADVKATLTEKRPAGKARSHKNTRRLTAKERARKAVLSKAIPRTTFEVGQLILRVERALQAHARQSLARARVHYHRRLAHMAVVTSGMTKARR